MLKFVDGEIKRVDEPALTAINMRLRDDYTADCQRGLDRWNKVIGKTGVDFQLELPHVGFHRQIGEFQNVKVSPTGELHRRGGLEPRHRQMAAVEGRRRLHRQPDAAGHRAWPIRQLDRPAARSASTTSRAISNT